MWRCVEFEHQTKPTKQTLNHPPQKKKNKLTKDKAFEPLVFEALLLRPKVTSTKGNGRMTRDMARA